MTSKTFIKAGWGAALALGLVVAPLAISPAIAADESATAVAPPEQGSTAELAPAGSLPTAVTAAGTLAAPNVIINEAYLNGGSANAAYKNKYVGKSVV